MKKLTGKQVKLEAPRSKSPAAAVAPEPTSAPVAVLEKKPPIPDELKARYAVTGPPAAWVSERAPKPAPRGASQEKKPPAAPSPATQSRLAVAAAVAARAEELGVPVPVARNIVEGRDTLEAWQGRVERRTRAAAVKTAAAELDVSLSVAANILDGRYTLETWRAREAERLGHEGQGRAVLEAWRDAARPIVVHRYDDDPVGVLTILKTYSFKVRTETRIRDLNKLKVMYLHTQDDASGVAACRRIGPDVQALALGPERHVVNRYQLPADLPEGRSVQLTFRDGSAFCGVLAWTDRFHLFLRLETGAELLCYKHGLYAFAVL